MDYYLTIKKSKLLSIVENLLFVFRKPSIDGSKLASFSHFGLFSFDFDSIVTSWKPFVFVKHSTYDFDPDFSTDCTVDPDFKPHIWSHTEARQAIDDEMEKQVYTIRLKGPSYYLHASDVASLRSLQHCVDGSMPSFDTAVFEANGEPRVYLPYEESNYLRQKATSVALQSPEAIAASRRRCRSFLVTSSQPKPDDDLLGD